MNQEPNPLFRIPPFFILLDILGTLLLVVGLYDLLVTGARLLPMHLRFEHYEITLMMIGGLLMLPLIMMLLEFIRYSRQAQRNSPN